MDNKSDRRWKLENLWHRHQDARSSRSPVAKFLREHKQSLLTGILLFVLLVLLFGIFSQMPAPLTDNPPNGVTVVSYSTFVQRVKAGNIRTVTIQGDELTGVLAHPLHGGACIAPPNDATSDPFAPMPVSPPVDSACTLYTHIPASGDAALLPLLHSRGVVIMSHRSDVQHRLTIRSHSSQFLVIVNSIELCLLHLVFETHLLPLHVVGS